MLKRLLRYLALRHGKAISLYRKFGSPSTVDWADVMRAHGGFFHIGAGSSMLTSTMIIDPALTSIGNHVQLGACTLICHDGAIETIAKRHGLRLDRVGAIEIEDEVFVGEGAIIMASNSKVVIGAGSLIGAGAVVRQSVPPDSIVIGNPAKVVGQVTQMLRFWEADTLAYPWSDIIQARTGSYDSATEPDLMRRRQIHFFGRAKD